MAKRKHLPSGVFVVSLGKDSKIHTKSIGLHPYLGHKMLVIDTNSELMLKQLDTMGVGGCILPPPMVTTGLNRKEAKVAYKNELSIARLDS